MIHIRHRHQRGFTIVSNHLALHPTLSDTAISLGVRLLALPDGVDISIKTLARRVGGAGQKRVADALHELEAEGYLRRERAQLECGRWITRTWVYDQPVGHPCRTEPPSPMQPPTSPSAEPEAAVTGDVSGADDVDDLDNVDIEPGLRGAAEEVLRGLVQRVPCLLLSAREVRRLAPAAALWLQRGVQRRELAAALTTGLPQRVHHPAALLGRRLIDKLPDPRPAPESFPARLRECAGCGRPGRAGAMVGGRCAACRGTGPGEGGDCGSGVEDYVRARVAELRELSRGARPYPSQAAPGSRSGVGDVVAE
ncbi:helix-turn-helix domain-containing protein [Streptomyces sp. XD-27]|uniref:helix-turn-helix domain-containing protein n=1 Tax=Streptomyces sp. XD-27 TaxID=3062779 RepID=UPI0026F45809|nr:helix-turn-helix domain-containing protein [Streptomyces sp. XD-27]WKX72538.1 helix-turn-helix domain-containing protein [Streptomyces sp. XD-27]